ncbi:trypsin-like peptidase domain-containing protein [Bradyrhizobium diazoefficiens]|uniref:trypsin-like peptidase domain-containing protein n=1 Tax=Bradyrhizobium diazoefficiens TaxID=1355477 RepID=UPI0034800F16
MIEGRAAGRKLERIAVVIGFVADDTQERTVVMPYFKMDAIYQIHDTAVEVGLAGRREDLMAGLSQAFIAELDEVAAPSGQLFRDLTKLNQTDPIDGEIPFERWLRNAAFLVSLRPEKRAYFRDLADELARQLPPSVSNPTPALKAAAIPERILFVSDMVAFGFLGGARYVGEATARLRVPLYQGGAPKTYRSGKPMVASGTGWLIGSRHLITNDHVVGARAKGEPRPAASDIDQQALHATVQFDYDAEGLEGTIVPVGSLCVANEGLDYAVLELVEDTGRGPLALRGEALTLPSDGRLPVNIIQHPNGGVKQIAMRNNLAVLLNDRDLAYFTDTNGGSSGSAVCDDDWKVVALHKSSDPTLGTFEYQGKTTSWINTGTRIDRIIADLKRNHAACWAKIEEGRKK